MSTSSTLQDFEDTLGKINVSSIPRHRDITDAEFAKSYFSKEAPVILEEKLTDWKALQKWTPQFFKEQYLNYEFDAQIKMPESGAAGFLKRTDYSHKMSLGDILDMMAEEQGQNCRVGDIPIHMLPGIEKHFDFNVFIDTMGISQKMVSIWFASQGTRSNLHWDPHDNFLAQVYGSKLVLLYAPPETKYLYPFEGDVRVSRIDPHYPDFNTYPRYRHANMMIGILGPGEMLFLPKGWWHQLRNVNLTISVNCFFGKGPSPYCFLRAALLSGVRQWATIIRDFFFFGVLDREPERFMRPGNPTGKVFYSFLADPIKRRLPWRRRNQDTSTD